MSELIKIVSFELYFQKCWEIINKGNFVRKAHRDPKFDFREFEKTISAFTSNQDFAANPVLVNQFCRELYEKFTDPELKELLKTKPTKFTSKLSVDIGKEIVIKNADAISVGIEKNVTVKNASSGEVLIRTKRYNSLYKRLIKLGASELGAIEIVMTYNLQRSYVGSNWSPVDTYPKNRPSGYVIECFSSLENNQEMIRGDYVDAFCVLNSKMISDRVTIPKIAREFPIGMRDSVTNAGSQDIVLLLNPPYTEFACNMAIDEADKLAGEITNGLTIYCSLPMWDDMIEAMIARLVNIKVKKLSRMSEGIVNNGPHAVNKKISFKYVNIIFERN